MATITTTPYTVWVDGVNGNDSTATLGNPYLPYLTIEAAVDAVDDIDPAALGQWNVALFPSSLTTPYTITRLARGNLIISPDKTFNGRANVQDQVEIEGPYNWSNTVGTTITTLYVTNVAIQNVNFTDLSGQPFYDWKAFIPPASGSKLLTVNNSHFHDIAENALDVATSFIGQMPPHTILNFQDNIYKLHFPSTNTTNSIVSTTNHGTIINFADTYMQVVSSNSYDFNVLTPLQASTFTSSVPPMVNMSPGQMVGNTIEGHQTYGQLAIAFNPSAFGPTGTNRVFLNRSNAIPAGPTGTYVYTGLTSLVSYNNVNFTNFTDTATRVGMNSWQNNLFLGNRLKNLNSTQGYISANGTVNRDLARTSNDTPGFVVAPVFGNFTSDARGNLETTGGFAPGIKTVTTDYTVQDIDTTLICDTCVNGKSITIYLPGNSIPNEFIPEGTLMNGKLLFISNARFKLDKKWYKKSKKIYIESISGQKIAGEKRFTLTSQGVILTLLNDVWSIIA